MKKKKGLWLNVIGVLFGLGVLGAAAVLGINAHMKSVGKALILTPEEAAELEDADCILVLGCLVRKNGTPSSMLADRLERGVELYELGAAPKLLMSGDHGRTDYNEVQTMKEYAVEAGIDSSDVFMDHAGFSTYDSMYRAKEVFAAKKVVIVSQEYHLYRALYIADRLGLEAYGVAAEGENYSGQTYRELREMLARVKDFMTALIQPEPTYLGDVIPVSGDGNLTNDQP